MLTLSPVTSIAEMKQLYKFSWQVNHTDPNWVPGLWPEYKAYFERRVAFFSFGEGEFWLARRDGQVVGTIGAAIDHARNQALAQQAAFFGFFEVMPGDYETANALWQKASEWAQHRGMTELHGPHSFTTSDEPGFLIEGFDTAPAVLMSHSQPYYVEFAERFGFRGGDESLAYRLDFSQIGFDLANVPPVVHRIAERASRRHGSASIRKGDLSDWDAEIKRILPVYNKSLGVLNGSAPMELAEFQEQAGALREIMDPDLVLIAELDGKVVGFALGLPNVNEALKHANGFQYPWDYLRFAAARRRITGASFKILVMDPDFWGFGLEVMMYLRMGQAFLDKGYTWIDASLTSADNPQTNKIAGRFGARVYRRYREYRLNLNGDETGRL